MKTPRLRGSVVAIVVSAVLLCASAVDASAEGTYRNPVLFGDYSDPDAVRVGDDYYMVSSSFQAVPALPILHSRDLVNWTIVAHAAPRLPSPDFDTAQHGNGIWAPSLRHHDGYFWIYVGDPDRGIYMTRARDPRGPWEPLTLVKQAKGWIDPCPLWDDDGSMYLVHAWAKSRAGVNGILTVRRMSADGRSVLDEGTTVFDGRELHPTIEGPKFYKRNGWYLIFAPAGGVKTGWQTVLRSKNVFGPYEEKIVLEQGLTPVNGPHQGAWVETPDGASWFLHFQDRGAYGRIVHLQPMTWLNDWPVIGEDRDGDGKGEPVLMHLMPSSSSASRETPLPAAAGRGRHVAERSAGEGFSEPDKGSPQTTDEFNDDSLGLQWQWHGNPSPKWSSLQNGSLRLRAVPQTRNLWNATNLLLQKLPAESFTATTKIVPKALRVGERAGLVVMGADYSTLAVEKTANGYALTRATNRNADKDGAEKSIASLPVSGPLFLRVTFAPEAIARFAYSTDGATFIPIGGAFVARPGRWIGAKVGLFATAPLTAKKTGSAHFDFFRIESAEANETASLIVAQDGSADYRTIQEAVDAIPADNAVNRTILIRNGVYREKVLLDVPFLSLVGEDREKTRVELDILRSAWRASHADDYGAAVINIGPRATDINLANLTVVNDYGRKHGGTDDHQFAIRSMPFSNRIALLNVNAIADGGDTVSLWNSDSGLSYYADSYFEGHVDYLCPRGWAYVTNSRFFGHNTNASIWHDGSKNEEQKLVIRHSSFDGIPNFALGRNHRDAAFYLIDVTFSPNMADRAIYPSPAPDPRVWGERYYYANARRTDGITPSWAADNLHTAKGSPREEDITASWTFNGEWDPATLPAVLPFAAIPRPEHGSRWIDPAGVTLRWTPGRNATASRVHFGDGISPSFHKEDEITSFDTGALEPGKTYFWRVDSVTPDGVIEGPVWSFRADPRTVRIGLAGDSTMTAKSGWGRGFAGHVAQDAAVLNFARGGRSSKSFRNEGHWSELLRRKPSHVLIQFGHNDVPGKGLDRETTLPVYRANLAQYVDEARAAGSQPILVTPLTRRYFRDDGRVHSDLEEHASATRAVAAEKNVPLIDLHAKSIELLDSLGSGISPALGPLKADGTLDKTHLNEDGSALFGALMAEEVRRVAPSLRPHVRETKRPAVNAPWSVRMAESEVKRTPDPMWLDANNAPRWEYTPGLVLKSILDVYHRTGDERLFKYVHAYYDGMINDEGQIAGGYKLEDYNIDRINPGKPLFYLYAKTKNEKYRKAIELLREQMRKHPRTKEGGFWHKKRYPWQMWLDGLYMGAPFLVQYAVTFNEPALLDDMITQFVLMEKNARDEKTGLLYHGWDESRQQKWADPKTGRSPEFWGRAMGWYAMGLVETLDFVPVNHPRRKELVGILQRLAEAVVKVQDPKTGVWWQVLDKGGREGNYLESSVSSMLSFALMKAARQRILDPQYGEAGRRAYRGILEEFIEVDDKGLVNIHRVCQVAGLGGDPEKGEKYRSGTYDYYISEKIRSNDPKATGPFIFASLEYER